MIRRVHQIFFDIDGKTLNDYPMFVRSRNLFSDMPGWRYTLWKEQPVEKLCRDRYPRLWPVYQNLKHQIQKIDLAKIMICDAFGGCFSDLDVLPCVHLFPQPA